MKKSERAQRRLSKPRSLKHYTSSQLDLSHNSPEGSSPAVSTGSDYFGPDAVLRGQSTRRSKSKSRSRLRAYLYGSPSKSLVDASSDEDTSSPSSSVPDATKRSKPRLSRSGSVFTQRSSVRDSTTLLVNAQGGVDDDDLEDTETIAKQIKERAHHDRLAASNHKPLLDDEDADPSFLPIRRKSLFTPGLATRNASDILKKPCAPSPKSPQSPLSDADLNYYYDKSHPEDSPLSCLAALKLPVDGRGTPSSLNVPNLGGLKHGTLHVTNGLGTPVPLSPRPASVCRSPTFSHIERDEFHTASEGSICDRGSSPSPEPVSSPRSESPIRPLNEQKPVQSVPLPTKIVNLGAQSALSSTIALDYIAELGETPFSRSEPCSRSPSPALEDLGNFGLQPFQSPGAFHMQTSTTTSFQDRTDDHQSSSIIVYSSGPVHSSHSTTQTSTSVETRDSGYHSTESLNKSSRADCDVPAEHFFTGSPVVTQFTAHEYAAKDNHVDLIHSSSTGAEMSTSTVACTKAQGRKLQKERPKTKGLLRHSVTDSALHTTLMETTIPRVPSAMAVRHAQRLVDFPLLEHTYPTSNHVKPANSPRFNHALPAVIRFPEVQPLTDTDELEADPSYPMQIESINRPQALQTRRWSTFGTSGKVSDAKRLVKKSEEARRKEEKDRLKSLEQERKQRERDDYGEVRTSDWRARATSRVRGKSVERRSTATDHSGTIADLGTVAHSIGGSPYDIATNIHPRAISGKTGYFPHQLGAARPRPRSFVGMDDLTASEFAHARSRLRQRPPRDRPKTICSDTVKLEQHSQAPTHLVRSGFADGIRDGPPTRIGSQDPTVESNGTTIDWQDHQSAWRERRKSAGHALRSSQFTSATTITAGLDRMQQPQPASVHERQGTNSPRKATISPTIASLAGRYEGGFDFGFERGCGVGGSAGTRNLGNSTTRKSEDVSKGYGLDLSDLPVFVAHAPR